MTGIFSASDILDAFIASTASDREHDVQPSRVTFALRGGLYGYVRVYGPSAELGQQGQPCVAVERYNGAVIFNHEGIARRIGAASRPDDKYITEHPLGCSSGARGNFGTMRWGLAPAGIAQTFPTPAALVAAIVDAFGKESVSW